MTTATKPTKAELSRQRRDKILAKLRNAGISVKEMKGSRHADAFFAELNVSRTSLNLLLPDSAIVKVAGTSKKLAQAVIRVEEGERSWKESPTIYISDIFEKEFPAWSDYVYTEGETDVPKNVWDDEEFLDMVKGTLTHASGMTFEVNSVETCFSSRSVRIRATVKAPGDVFTLLVGTDEEHMFVCRTAELATSVKHAHELLRPDGVTDEAIRIGEYFFQPLSDEEHEHLMHEFFRPGVKEDSTNKMESEDSTFYFSRNTPWYMMVENLDPELADRGVTEYEEVDSLNHEAAFTFEVRDNNDRDNTRTFVMGAVYDTQNRHETVHFPYLTEVFHNREVLNESDRWD